MGSQERSLYMVAVAVAVAAGDIIDDEGSGGHLRRKFAPNLESSVAD